MTKLNPQLEPLALDLLAVIAKVRCVTQFQALCLFFRRYDMVDISAVLHWAFENELIATLMVDIPEETDKNIRAGRTKMRSVEIYFLEPRGRDFLLRHRENAWCVKTLYPTEIFRERMFHDLLVVEALLWMIATYDVIDFWVEDEIRGYDQHPADLRVAVNPGGDEYEIIDCEVVVQNRGDAINKKMFGMIWFTPSSTQMGLIQDLKPNDKVVQINVHGRWKARVTPPTNLSKSEERLFWALRRHGGVLTSDAVAAVVGRRREKVNAALLKLARAGHLCRSTVQTSPGRQKGRPNVLYALDPCFCETWADREFAARYSHFIEFFKKKPYEVVRADRTSDSALLAYRGKELWLRVMDRDELASWWEQLMARLEARRQAEVQGT